MKILRQAQEPHQRTRNVIVNTMTSAFIKAASLACSLIVVPVTINYLNPENYGVWMAMTSILYWFAFMDVGLGNGMRNYLADAFARNDEEKARSYFSTAMCLLSIIAIILAVILLPLIYLLDLNALFNVSKVSGTILADVLAVAVIFSLLQFVVKNVGLVYVAMQKYAVNDFVLFTGNLCSLLIVYLLTKTTEGNLLYVALAVTSMPVGAFSLAYVWLIHRHPSLRPAVKYVDMSLARQVVGKGLGFFVIQISSCLVIFGSANIFISHFCGPGQVTVYNLSYKLFNLLIIGFTILIGPLWSAYTDAAATGDYVWIRRAFKRSLQMWLLTVACGIVLLVASPWLIRWWIDGVVDVPFVVSLVTFCYVSMFNFANCMAHLLNGMNILRVHILTSLVTTAIYLLVVVAFGLQLGVIGIVLTMATAYLIMGTIYGYQAWLLVNQRATGIWLK